MSRDTLKELMELTVESSTKSFKDTVAPVTTLQ